jgi:hypothetical protein
MHTLAADAQSREPSLVYEKLIAVTNKAPSAGVGVFGGSGFYKLLDDVELVDLSTHYGHPSDRIAIGTVAQPVNPDRTHRSEVGHPSAAVEMLESAFCHKSSAGATDFEFRNWSGAQDAYPVADLRSR